MRFSERYEQEVIDAYLECALWTGVVGQDPDESIYDLTMDDLADEARIEAAHDVAAFLGALEEHEEWADVSPIPAARMGHDFYLTRNRHGAGFWDRGLGELGDRLTVHAHSFGEAVLSIADDGKAYF